ncbi:hypothetical protein LTR66_001174 [Elasticomyces elasticus]|nr:hypothetical protein LTR66_001174 [Elasticomyces elasticus]
MSSTPPPLVALPTSKERKYDRQLRLWAASGQAALEDAHVLLLNSGSGVTGIEALKNLVLPGVGSFTILDSAIVTEADLGVNFFLDDDCLGGYRAEHCCRLLNELNPDVKGHAITEPVESFIAKQDALRPYTLILTLAPVDPSILHTIRSHAQSYSTPVFYIHCIGFYAHFSLLLPPAFPIVDTHPDSSSTTDLRLLTPWPDLINFAREKTQALETMSDHDHGHVPYVLLLLHYLEGWKATHDGNAPGTYKEKSEFRETVRAAARTDDENFDEAVAAVLKSLNPPTPSSAVRDVLSAPECQNPARDSPSFWLIANAIVTFLSSHGNQLPLPGAVPDMKSQSNDYIALQNIYKAKARRDIAEVTASVRSLEKQLGRPTSVPDSEIEAFCKGAAHVKLVRGHPFHVLEAQKLPKFGDRAGWAVNAMQDPESGLLIYVAFLAWDLFVASHSDGDLMGAPRMPGLKDVQDDEEKVVGTAEKIVDAVINEAGTFIEEPGYSEVKEGVAKVVKEL